MIIGVIIFGIILCALVIGCFVFIKIMLPKKEKPRNDKPIIGCIGDSITFGAGVIWHRESECWPRVLEHQLQGDYQVLNYGISGATLLKSGNRPYNPKFLAKIKSYNPEIFLLMLGTNDSKPYNWNVKLYKSEMIQLIQELKRVSAVKRIILMAPPFTAPLIGKQEVAFHIKNNVIRDEIRPIVKEVSLEQEVEFLDLYELTENHAEYYIDGVHPNALGNKVIADVIYKAIRDKQD